MISNIKCSSINKMLQFLIWRNFMISIWFSVEIWLIEWSNQRHFWVIFINFWMSGDCLWSLHLIHGWQISLKRVNGLEVWKKMEKTLAHIKEFNKFWKHILLKLRVLEILNLWLEKQRESINTPLLTERSGKEFYEGWCIKDHILFI